MNQELQDAQNKASEIHSGVCLILSKQGVKANDTILLKEAYRRYMNSGNGRPLKIAWVGLGMPSHYKSKYFRPLHRVTPRVLNWWLLSEKGIEVMEGLITAHPIPTDPVVVTQLNKILF